MDRKQFKDAKTGTELPLEKALYTILGHSIQYKKKGRGRG
jgi:hypothetical protein